MVVVFRHSVTSKWVLVLFVCILSSILVLVTVYCLLITGYYWLMVTGFQPAQAERIPVPLPLATVETGIERNGILGVGAGNNQRRFTDPSTTAPGRILGLLMHDRSGSLG